MNSGSFVVYTPPIRESYVLPGRYPFPKMGPGIVYAPYIPIYVKVSWREWLIIKLKRFFSFIK